jgi:hypothetical protein
MYLRNIHAHTFDGARVRFVTIHATELQLSLGSAPLGSLKKPFERNDIVARGSFSRRVDFSTYLLGDGIALIGQGAKHLDRSIMVTHGVPSKPLDEVAGTAGDGRLQ